MAWNGGAKECVSDNDIEVGFALFKGGASIGYSNAKSWFAWKWKFFAG
jgi:hypothetical protein